MRCLAHILVSAYPLFIWKLPSLTPVLEELMGGKISCHMVAVIPYVYDRIPMND